jgi:hypothetical protein
LSDDYLRIIPADPNLIPPKSIADQIVNLVGPAFPEADEVVAESHGHPVFIDQGTNLEAILCPACGKRLPFHPAQEVDALRDWWYELSDPLGEASVVEVKATMPCCQAVVPFSRLQFDWPAGVASFEISIMNPGTSDSLPAELQRQVEALLGGPVKYVWAHY